MFDCQSTNFQKWSQKNAKNKKSSWMQNKKNTMQRYCERLEKRLRTNEMSEVLIDERIFINNYLKLGKIPLDLE